MQIQRSFKEETSQGKLYLVPTPIGNLEDMTFRAITVLNQVDLICAEDTRNTGLLLKHFEIMTRQTSFHDHNSHKKIPDLIAFLKAGHSIAQISDAGLPSISDPGHDLVCAALEANISVIALPGASAGITGLIASGLAPQPHVFYGFLPRKKGQQESFFLSKKDYPETQIFYESPHRVATTLEVMQSIYGNRQLVLVRELTKLYEEYQRGSIEEIRNFVKEVPLKGECLLIVSGSQGSNSEESIADSDIKNLIEEAIKQGLKPNQAIKKVAKTYGLNRQEVYNLYHNL